MCSYEVLGSGLEQQLSLSSAEQCHLACVHNSAGDGAGGRPFGFLKKNRAGKLTLYVLPYDFPRFGELVGTGHQRDGVCSTDACLLDSAA